MTKHLIGLSVAIALASMAGTALAGAPVMFAYHFKAGSSSRYRVKFNQDVAMGGKSSAGQIADLEVTLTCTAADEKTNSMKMTFDKADISRRMLDNIEPDPTAEKLVGQSLTFTVSAGGVVTNVQPTGNFEAWDQVQPFLQPLVEGWYVRLPQKSVPEGGEWKDDGRVDKGVGGMNVTTNAHFKFKERKTEHDRDCAVVNAEVENILSGKSVTAGGTYDVGGGGKGKFELYFDPATSMMVKFKGKMDVQMHLSPESGSANAIESNVSYQIERELL